MARHPLLRFLVHALPLLLLLLALFGFAVELLDLEPRAGSVIRLALFEQPRVPATLVLAAWLMEACGLVAIFLVAQGRCGSWWLDGLVAGWLAWIFRGPLLVLTIVVATRQPQDPWWALAFGWWLLYSLCGIALALLARRDRLGEPGPDPRAVAERHPPAEPAPTAGASTVEAEAVEAEAVEAETPADDDAENDTPEPDGEPDPDRPRAAD